MCSRLLGFYDIFSKCPGQKRAERSVLNPHVLPLLSVSSPRSTSSAGRTSSGSRTCASPPSRCLWRLQELWRKTTVREHHVFHLNQFKAPLTFCVLLLVGVILSSVISPDPNISPFMLILDAKTFTEVARASIPASIHLDLHGQFIPSTA